MAPLPTPPSSHELNGRPLTPPQRVFWDMMTDQRVANLMHAADVIGAMDADGLELLRHLGSTDAKPLRKFLYEAKPDTLAFLSELRQKEIGDISNAIEVGLAMRRTVRFIRYGVATLFAAFIGMTLIWDKFSIFFRGGNNLK